MASTIFDRSRRRPRRDRAAPRYGDHDFLRAIMLDGLAERLAAVTRSFTDMLDLGCFGGDFAAPPGVRVVRADAGFRFARVAGGVQADEDRLPFRDGAFDLVVSAGVLDQFDDLPGALSLIRRVLRPDGLFLGAFVGAPSLTSLRAALRAAERDAPAARIHPQVDVRAAGDLLVRAGFALPVADVETVTVRYPTITRLVGDLRGAAMTSLLSEVPPLSRAAIADASAAFASAAVNGKVAERFSLIYCTGWAPDPSQPVPARRGSAGASLATALGSR